MDAHWKAFSTLPQDSIQSIKRVREARSDQRGVSGEDILFEILNEDHIVRPGYDAWMSKYWALFWQWTREVAPREAAGIIRDSRTDWREILSVRTVDGSWSLLADSLLPGPVVPVDGSRDSNICIDVRYHSDDHTLLLQLGAVDSPRDSGQDVVKAQIVERFTSDAVAWEFQQQDGLLSTPQDNYLNFETSGYLRAVWTFWKHFPTRGRVDLYLAVT